MAVFALPNTVIKEVGCPVGRRSLFGEPGASRSTSGAPPIPGCKSNPFAKAILLPWKERDNQMKRSIVLVLVILSQCGPAYAECGVMPWSIPYLGSNTSTLMSVSSGDVCRIDTSVGSTNIITSIAISSPAGNGSASTDGGDVVMYRSQSGYTGPDSFTFTITGNGPGGSGSSSVQVDVTVR